MTTNFHRGVRDFLAIATAILVPAITSCHSGSTSVGVTVQPESAEVAPLTSQSFQVHVDGTLDSAVSWSLVDASGTPLTDPKYGSVSLGNYTAPGVVPRDRDNDFFVQATSNVDSSRIARARVHIIPVPLKPTRGPTAGGTRVTISGKDFVSGATVTFIDKDGIRHSGTDVSVESSVLLRVTTPAVPAIGPVSVEIKSGQTTVTYPLSFHYGATQLRFSGGQIAATCESTSGSTFMDVNGDGALDAVIACRYDMKLVVLLNDGFGGLGKAQSVSTMQTYPHDLVVSDQLGDGKNYLLVSEAQGIEKFEVNGSLVSKGQLVDYPGTTYEYYSRKAVLDYDGDGKNDIVFTLPASMNIYSAAGDGQGGFGAPVVVQATQYYPYDFRAVDFTGDGKLDLLATYYELRSGVSPNFTYSNPGGFSSWVNQGSGTWGARIDHATINYSSSLAVGDFNKDGSTDIATGPDGDTDVSVSYVNPVTHAIAAATIVPTTYYHDFYPYYGGQLNAADVDGDGASDLILGNSSTEIFYGQTGGLNTTSVIYDMADYPYSATVVALDPSATLPGLVGVNYNSVEIHPANAARQFGAPKVALANEPDYLEVNPAAGVLIAAVRTTVGPPAGALGVVDVGTIQGVAPSKQVIAMPSNTSAKIVNWASIDGDSMPDVIAVDDGSYNAGVGAVWTFFGNATGYDAPTKVDFSGIVDVAYPKDVITDARMHDVTGDGIADLVVAENDGAGTNPTGNIRIIPGTGNKAQPFVDVATTNAMQVGVQPYRLRFADVDDDGIDELVTTDKGGSRVGIIPFDEGVVGAPIFVATGDSPSEIIVTDVDGDFVNDLIVLASYFDPFGYDTLIEVDVVRGLGDRQFDLPTRYRFAGGNAYGLQYEDLDGDGLRDIAVTVDYPASVQVLRGHDGGNFQDAETALVGGSPRGIAICDFDGDGKLDLIVGDSSTGSLRLLANGSR